MKKSRFGFTLIELLIVIAIIAILAVVIFVALNPLERFRSARDAVRAQDVNAIIDAIKLYQIDHDGYHIEDIENMAPDLVYMITDGEFIENCDDWNSYCDTAVQGDGYCVDLSDLADGGYLAEVPVSPDGEGTWLDYKTGYTLVASTTGPITVRACESEGLGTPEIEVSK